MLMRIFFFTLIVTLFSCSKNQSKGPLVGSVSFSANGTFYSWSEQGSGPNYFTTSIFPSTPGNYHLSATNEFSGNLLPAKIVYLTIPTTALVTNTPFTFTNSTVPDPIFPPHQIAVSNITTNDPFNLYNASEIGDFATVTITLIHDQMADGTFTAKLRRASDSSVINITNGTFKNVAIMP